LKSDAHQPLFCGKDLYVGAFSKFFPPGLCFLSFRPETGVYAFCCFNYVICSDCLKPGTVILPLSMLRPRSATSIVDATAIIPFYQLRNEDRKIFDLSNEVRDPESARKWLASRHLLKNSCTCTDCGQPTTVNKYEENVDNTRNQIA
jgi:hypothetical protein